MRTAYQIVYQGGSGEVLEKKSRFIAEIRPVKTEEKALLFLEEMRKRHWNARHNCYAWIIGKNGEEKRCGDDGEPSQTAGRPMLSVLEGEGVTDTCAVVTRYFGGTLLGTGGLSRAYGGAVRKGLDDSIILRAMPAFEAEIAADYAEAGKIKYFLEKEGIVIRNAAYGERVAITVLIPEEKRELLLVGLAQLTGGRPRVCGLKEVYYGLLGETAVLL